MNAPLVFTSWKEAGLAQLETILRRWGTQVQFFDTAKALGAALRKERPDLLMFDAGVARDVPPARCPTIILAEDGEAIDYPAPHERLSLPLDIAALHDVLQKSLTRCQRRNLRMSVRLPSIILRKGASSIGEVVSLSTAGAFIKTGCADLRKGDRIDVVIPLMGMKKELELSCTVLYQIQPGPENNYQQGVGVAFAETGAEAVRAIYKYIGYSLLHDSEPRATGHELPATPATVVPPPPQGRDCSRHLFLRA
jgi:Tfp pilus assembly protein PilZ